MLDNLVNLVQQVAGSSITNNPAIPNENHNAVIKSAAEGIFKGLQSQATGGGLNQILGMLTSAGGSGISSSLSQSVQSSVVSSLTGQSGIKSELAKTIAAQLVPTVLGALSKHTADPNNSTFNVGGILNSLTGGKTNGVDVQGLLDKFAGGADGKFDLGDVANMLGGGGKTSGGSGGGLLGALGGLLGK
jgi:hypothetical protein